MITSTEASGHLRRRDRLRRRAEAPTVAENFSLELTQIDTDDENAAVDLLHNDLHNESRELQQKQGPPPKPELSVRSNGSKIDAAASFHQGGRRSIRIFDKDCITTSPLQFTVDGMPSTSSYTYSTPAEPADGTVDFEISLRSILSLKDKEHPNDDVVLCILLETTHTLHRTLLTVHADLYKESTFGMNAQQSAAAEDAAAASTTSSTAESGRLVGRVRKHKQLLRKRRRGGQ